MDPGGLDLDLDLDRRELLEEFETWTEWPMAILAFVWIALLVLEFTGSRSPYIEPATSLIWGIFIVEFVVRFALSNDRRRFVRKNWLTAIALIVPAFRLFRFAAVLRGAAIFQGLRLTRIVTVLNRGMRSWRKALGARRLPFVVLFSAVVGFVGAAGMYTFETGTNPAFATFGDALFWSGMILITLGSGNWPETGAGRILAFLLGLYSFSVFGYITAALASVLIERDRVSEGGERTVTSGTGEGEDDALSGSVMGSDRQ
jgi:voltage-gated potassium channel